MSEYKTQIPKCIIITNDDLNNDKNKIFEKYKPFKISSLIIKDVINCRYFNPGFFQIIIINSNVDVYEDQVLLLYNNLLINGTYIIDEKYYKMFYKLGNPTKKYKNYILIHKKNNKIFKSDYYKKYLDCMIIGAQKSGTSSLISNLSKHKDISVADEIHYLDIYFKKGIKYLTDNLNYKKKITIEKNPEIIYLGSEIYWMIQNLNPYMKIIVTLRNPITRCYSSYSMNVKSGYEKLTFEQAIENELKYRIDENKTFYTSVYHYLQKGLYYNQLLELFKWFPKQNIKIIIMEKMIENEEETYNDLFDFLDISKQKIILTKERVGDYKNKISDEMYKKLKKYYFDDVEKLEKLLNIKTRWFNK